MRYAVENADGALIAYGLSLETAESYPPTDGWTIRVCASGKRIETHFASDGTWWKWEDGQPGSGPASRKVGA